MTYWALKDWWVASNCASNYESKLVDGKPVARSVELTTGRVKQYFDESDTESRNKYSRSIGSVTYHNDSKATAIVRITNITPVPENSEPTTDEIERRKRGLNYRFVLEKEQDKWKISEIWRPWFFNGSEAEVYSLRKGYPYMVFD
jgi:hypothetical protein